MITNTDYVSSWKSKGLSAKSIKPPTISNNRLNPELDYYGAKTGAEFYECCLKQNKVTFDYGKIVNIYIKYEIIKVANINGNRNSNLIIQNALFEAVSLTKNIDIGKYKYSGYGIAFDKRSLFSHSSSRDGQNVIIFGVDMSSSTKIDNRKKDIFILGKGPMQGLEHILSVGKGPIQGLEHTLSVEKMYLILARIV